MVPITSRSFTALARLSINSRVIELTGGLVVHTFIRVYECKCIVYVNIFRLLMRLNVCAYVSRVQYRADRWMCAHILHVLWAQIVLVKHGGCLWGTTYIRDHIVCSKGEYLTCSLSPSRHLLSIWFVPSWYLPQQLNRNSDVATHVRRPCAVLYQTFFLFLFFLKPDGCWNIIIYHNLVYRW